MDEEAFDAAAAEGRALGAEAAQLGVNVEPLASQLAQRAKRHCLCCRPYVEDAGMVACDSCKAR